MWCEKCRAHVTGAGVPQARRMKTIASRRFMACRTCWLFHEIDADGQWVWRCPEEEQAEHERAKGAA